MKAPLFWWERTPSFAARILQPISFFYKAIADKKFNNHPSMVDVPTVVVGNFVAGGAGKTPVVLWLVQALRERGLNPFIVSRGYGGQMRGPLRVEPYNTAQQVGDEPCLMAQYAPVIIAKERLEGAQLAVAQGAQLLIFDDGFQSRAVHMDYALMVVDGSVGVGNGLCLPAGPLRASLDLQFVHTDGVVMFGEGEEFLELEGKPFLKAHIEANKADMYPLKGKKVLAFAGIGRPQKFFEMLVSQGVDVVHTQPFADHYVYREKDLQHLKAQGDALEAVLVTTEKDYMRLGTIATQYGIGQVRISCVVEGGQDVLQAIETLLPQA